MHSRVFIILALIATRHPCDGWVTVKSPPLLQPSSLAAVGVGERKNNSADVKKTYRAADYSREPAGVAALIFSRPRSVRDSLKRSRRRANDFVRNRRWIIRRRERGIIELSEDNQQITLSELDIPDWACVNESERLRLATMKTLLQNDFCLVRDRTVALSPNGTPVHVVKAFPDVYGDLRLLRFLRKNRIQDPVSAADRYRSFLQWRIAKDVDTVRAHVETQPFSPPPHLDILKELVPCEFNVNEGGTEDTIPAVLYAGSWDTNAIMRLIQQDKLSLSSFLLYWMHIFESINLKLHQETIKRKKMMYVDEVCCLRGMCVRQFSPGFCSVVLKPWLKMTQGNYPETTKRIIFLNPPKVISIIWNIVAPMASPGTVAKVQLKRDFHGSCMEYVRNN